MRCFSICFILTEGVGFKDEEPNRHLKHIVLIENNMLLTLRDADYYDFLYFLIILCKG